MCHILNYVLNNQLYTRNDVFETIQPAMCTQQQRILNSGWTISNHNQQQTLKSDA